ncbi:hypothetical protein DNTS_029886 [Danionella cerebrum]|uniref:RING-type domain-containing protein n=1 Tax=Danionella cerebrum TaxID=2873325 RepID=A0A553RLQ1_9TELE|nr:hypothetical protein DNTS_029886 [Danionella translucida]
MEMIVDDFAALEQVCKHCLPSGIHKFLFGPLTEFPVARHLMGALFGAISGVGLFFGLIHNIPMTAVQYVIVGCVFVGLCTVGGTFSSLFRCSIFLMFPSLIGSQGRTLIMVLVLNELYQGPIANIQHNVQDVASSMGCNIDLQITHSKLMWRMLTEPYVEVVEEIVNDSGYFHKEAENANKQFQKIRNEVMGSYGYDSLGQQSGQTANSTQEEYVEKTKARCDYVVQQGIERCREWFGVKWKECMDTIEAPLINNLLCIPMQFDFLCDVMRVMNPWCVEKIPIEGNFGQIYDKLNDSINKLAEHFTADLVLKKSEQQPVFGVNVLQDFSKELKRLFQEKAAIARKITGVINFLLSFTFITVFISAFGYVHKYCRDIRFDNVYITTYFRQIDARRNRGGKRYLLPLKKSEQGSLINPRSISIHASELMPVVVGFLQVAFLALFMCVLLAVDKIFYNIFDLIRRHTFTTYSFAKVQHADIRIGGDSILARILRKTVDCLPQPHSLSQSSYMWLLTTILLMALMCFMQVYTNRLRRVFTAFYFPKLRSVLLVPLKHMGCRLHWCRLCDGFVRHSSGVECTSSEACSMIFCQQCWADLDKVCPACFPHELEVEPDLCVDVYYG